MDYYRPKPKSNPKQHNYTYPPAQSKKEKKGILDMTINLKTLGIWLVTLVIALFYIINSVSIAVDDKNCYINLKFWVISRPYDKVDKNGNVVQTSAQPIKVWR